MSMMFPALAKTHVHIGIGGGKYVVVPMLSVEDYGVFVSIQRELTALKDKEGVSDTEKVDAILDARRKIAALVCKVMPPELCGNVPRMDYPTIASLAAVLCTGNDNGEEDDPEKKTTLPSQL